MRKLCKILLCTMVALAAASGRPEQAPKDLVTYIQGARKLGLNESQIRRNATAAGWDPNIIDQAMSFIDRSDGGTAPPRDANAGATLPTGYRIGAGDVLQVSVWKEPEASVPTIAVRADGNITVPLIKDVEVAGLTPAEVERLLAKKLDRFIPGADVTVIVTQVNSRKVYLVGAVRTVGTLDLKSDMTVLQAITQAGGLTEYAKRKQIYILRTENGKQMKLPFNYEAVIKGESTEENVLVLPNDTIVVPQ